jgi:hypothetical protein
VIGVGLKKKRLDVLRRVFCIALFIYVALERLLVLRRIVYIVLVGGIVSIERRVSRRKGNEKNNNKKVEK